MHVAVPAGVPTLECFGVGARELPNALYLCTCEISQRRLCKQDAAFRTTTRSQGAAQKDYALRVCTPC